MRWLLGFIIAVPLPLVFLFLFGAGADSRGDNQILIYTLAVPIIVCSVYALYRLVRATELTLVDWAAIVIACLPFAWFVVARAFGLRG